MILPERLAHMGPRQRTYCSSLVSSDGRAKDSAPGRLGNKVCGPSTWAWTGGRFAEDRTKTPHAYGTVGQRKTCSPSTHIQCILGCFCSCPAVKDHKTNRLGGKRENTFASLPTSHLPRKNKTKNPK